MVAGVHFMAETAKLLNPGKTVLMPDLRRRLLAGRIITPADVRLLRQRYPGVPDRDLREHLGRGEGGMRHLLHLGQCAQSRRIARACRASSCCPTNIWRRTSPRETGVEIITWAGHCEVHERFTRGEIRQLREEHPGVIVLAHPECPPEVVAEADFAGSTAVM